MSSFFVRIRRIILYMKTSVRINALPLCFIENQQIKCVEVGTSFVVLLGGQQIKLCVYNWCWWCFSNFFLLVLELLVVVLVVFFVFK